MMLNKFWNFTGVTGMKCFDNTENNPDEFELERLNEEMNIIFGNIFGATTMVETHLENNFPHYSESYPFSQPTDNQGAVKEVNELAKLYVPQTNNKKIPQ